MLNRRTLLGSVALLAVLGLPGCATSYSAAPIEATVIDGETRQPLAGANVIAYWNLEGGGLEGGAAVHTLTIMEAVTDTSGRFIFPEWGPKTPPGPAARLRMHAEDPMIVIFKPGYEPKSLHGELTPAKSLGNGPAFRTSPWHGKVIPIARFTGSVEHYALLFRGVLSGINYHDCNWKNMPRMLVAVSRESARLERLGLLGAPTTIHHFRNDPGCGSVDEFFADYLK